MVECTVIGWILWLYGRLESRSFVFVILVREITFGQGKLHFGQGKVGEFSS